MLGSGGHRVVGEPQPGAALRRRPQLIARVGTQRVVLGVGGLNFAGRCGRANDGIVSTASLVLGSRRLAWRLRLSSRDPRPGRGRT
jgi:hypothetical protein